VRNLVNSLAGTKHMLEGLYL